MRGQEPQKTPPPWEEEEPPPATWRTTPITGRLSTRPGTGGGHWSISLHTGKKQKKKAASDPSGPQRGTTSKSPHPWLHSERHDSLQRTSRRGKDKATNITVKQS